MQDNDNDTWYVNLFKQLDAQCWQCRGKGLYGWTDRTQTTPMECDICYGTGYQPTRAGIELLNFLRRQRKRIEREQV